VGTDVDLLVARLGADPRLLFPLVLFEGPLTTIAAGVLVATGALSWPVAYAIAVTADVSGDSLYYAAGRWGRRAGARRLLDRLGGGRMAALESAMRRDLGRVLIGVKLVDTAAVPAFVLAGLARIAYGRVLAWTLLATAVKAGLLLGVGVVAGRQALRLVGFAPWLVPGVVLLVAAGVLARVLTRTLRRTS